MSPDATADAAKTLYTEYFSRLTTMAVRKFQISQDAAEDLAHELLMSTLLRQQRIPNLTQWLAGALEAAAKTYARGDHA